MSKITIDTDNITDTDRALMLFLTGKVGMVATETTEPAPLAGCDNPDCTCKVQVALEDETLPE